MDLENWRPISLLNTDYKMATKAIANRLAKVLPDIIKQSQACSVRGRSIHHHLILIRDLISFSNQTKRPLYVLSFDQRKAFDRVSWDFLFATLRRFGFSEDFISIIQTLYSDISSSFSINGELTLYVTLLRGVRQGCPLSLLLYILIAETLGNLIRSNPKLSFSIPDLGLALTHLQFADDFNALLSDISNFNLLKGMLDVYCRASASELNANKTRGIHINHPSKTPLPDIQWNCDDTKILGVIFTPNQTKNQVLNWNVVTKSIGARIGLLRMRKLSLKGKAVVLNTLVLSKAWFLARVFLPKNRHLKEIEATAFKYISANKHEKIARKILTLPVSSGGIGLLAVEDQCQSLQAASFAEITSSKPPVWTKIALMWLAGVLSVITPAWDSLYSNPYLTTLPKHYELILPFLRKVYPALTATVTVRTIRMTYNKIQDVTSPTLSARSHHDAALHPVVTHWEKSVKQNYETAGSPGPADTFFRFIHDALPSLVNINKWFRRHSSDTCLFCNSHPESTAHIFLCNHWYPVWDHFIPIISILRGTASFSRISIPKLITLNYRKPCKICNLFIFQIMHLIYLARNAAQYDNNIITPDDVIRQTSEYVKKDLRMIARHRPTLLVKFDDVINVLHDGSVTFNF